MITAASLQRALIAVSFPLLAAALLALAPGCNDCAPGQCEPCVGERCEVRCVEPDDEDVGYSCLWPCSDGADCSLSCEGVDCNLACTGSSCSCEFCDARCEAQAECAIASNGTRVGCDGSSCAVACVNAYNQGGACIEACTNGATCRMTCGEGGTVGPDFPPRCRMSCDASSSCHLECRGRCSLCCNGSPDCVLDCPGEATSCADGTVVCGVECGADFLFGEGPEDKCPVYDESWIRG